MLPNKNMDFLNKLMDYVGLNSSKKQPVDKNCITSVERPEYSIEYINQKAEEIKQRYIKTGCAPIFPLMDAWHDKSVPDESIKLYSDFISEEWAKKRHNDDFKTYEDTSMTRIMIRERELTKIVRSISPLERMAFDILRRN